MMTRRASWTIFLALPVAAFGQKKGKAGKQPEVELLEAAAHRQEGIISIDARVKNCGEKPIKSLQIIIDFVAPDHKQVITTKRGAIEAEVLEPGEEADFHARIEDPSRATEFRINFEDGGDKYLRGMNTGPFPID
ncbi:MAG: hypothetical protein ABJF23_25105 [Bryobacteraceae bacterium]